MNSDWIGYELLASGDGKRLERWNDFVVLRPESAAPWDWIDQANLPACDGSYSGTRATGGVWSWRRPFPETCVVNYRDLSFLIHPTNSKHMGLFPEQSSNWDWIRKTLKGQSRTEPPKILNLFGYTGGASLAATSAGAAVTHVDAARAMVSWCSENAGISGLSKAPIRYIVEDALMFLHREIRRGNRYDGIIMDPPSYGRGKKGELWKLSEHLPYLLDSAQEALSDHPLFLILNTYSDELEESLIIKRLSRLGGSVETISLSLKGTLDDLWIPCGISHRWSGESS
jgi:23S rRNA (cytosine1962-C5)-methyltransferase